MTKARVSPFRRAVRGFRGLARDAVRGSAAALVAGAASVVFILLKRFLAGPADLPSGAACLGAAAAVVALLASLTSPRARALAERVRSLVRPRPRDAKDAELEAAVRLVAASPPYLRGTFALVPLPIVVQALHASWRTGVLAADFGGRPGRIYFDRGEVVEARFGPATGSAAFNLMYAEGGGAFCFLPQSRPVKRSVDSRVLRLLVNAERSCRDESSVQLAVRPFPNARTHRRTPEHDRERAR